MEAEASQEEPLKDGTRRRLASEPPLYENSTTLRRMTWATILVDEDENGYVRSCEAVRLPPSTSDETKPDKNVHATLMGAEASQEEPLKDGTRRRLASEPPLYENSNSGRKNSETAIKDDIYEEDDTENGGVDEVIYESDLGTPQPRKDQTLPARPVTEKRTSVPYETVDFPSVRKAQKPSRVEVTPKSALISICVALILLLAGNGAMFYFLVKDDVRQYVKPLLGELSGIRVQVSALENSTSIIELEQVVAASIGNSNSIFDNLTEAHENISANLEIVKLQTSKLQTDMEMLTERLNKTDNEHNKAVEGLTKALLTEGWMSIVDHLYKQINQDQTYDAAAENCSAAGGRLAHLGLKNETTRGMIFHKLNGIPENGCWIGLRRYINNQWKWNDDTLMDSKNINLPQNGDCGCAKVTNDNTSIVSATCEVKRCYICEI